MAAPHRTLKVGILGPTGYTAIELINFLLRHPHARIVYLGSRREECPHIAAIWPSLRGRLDLQCAGFEPENMPEMDVAFIALPHTVAMDHVPGLLERGVAVVDLSADYRLKDPATYARYYKVQHKDPGNLAKTVYGMPEMFRPQIASAKLVANPGCYPTAITLAVAPLLKHGLARSSVPIVVDAKSGVTGAGRSPRPDLHYPEVNENARAYKVASHQHNGEIQQNFDALAGRSTPFCFVPHLIPMDRGILATCYVPLAQAASEKCIRELYADFYKSEPFVRVLEGDGLPTTKTVSYTNFCDVAVRVTGEYVIAISAIDNLVKGASGQAVQNMNIVFGLDERLGLA